MQRNTVFVLAPPNYPCAQAKRAGVLNRDLGNGTIPVERKSGIAFDIESLTDEQMRDIDRPIAVFEGGTPVVYVNGLAMSNSSTEQTIAACRECWGGGKCC